METSQNSPRRPSRTASSAGPIEAPSTITSSEKVDITVHCLLADGSIRHETNLTSHSELRTFLQVPLSVSSGQYLLSIEDISRGVAKDLSDGLHIEAEFFKDHTHGRLNSDGTQHSKKALHSQQLVSTLLGRASAKKENCSLTWWKLSTHSLSQYSFEIEALTESNADATKIVVPHFNVQISNTRRSVGTTKDQVAQVKSGAKEFLRQWKKIKAEAEHAPRKELAEETIFMLYSNTYRAHQVISEVKDNKWGSACEERLTFFKAKNNGSTFYILLFDQARTLRENKQVFETDYTNARSWGALNNSLHDANRRPIARMIREEAGELVGTFLTRCDDDELPASTPTQDETEIGVLSTTEAQPVLENSSPEKSLSDESTRHRFLSNFAKQSNLNLSGPEGSDDLPALRIKITFIRMIAHDYDLVLSQMGQTLDDIDRKISDNTDLRENILAWRRLLGSWRMTIIEYKAKLMETHQFLSTQAQGSTLADIVSSEETIRSIENDLEDLTRSYEILEAAIKVIEIRVDKTFQALMSSMSILESQKAITQGSAVARLTELAFIFIPLNFACTFFSMQIKEFQTSPPTIGAFFALAVPLMLLLYALRAFIRSSLLRKIRHRLDTRIRETSKIPGTSEIPTRVIISFGWRQLGPFYRALLIVVPFMVLVLWLIYQLGHWKPFRIVGSLVTVIGTLVIVIFLAFESYVPALQIGAITAWIISMLSIGLGRTPPLNSAVMGTLCTVVTTIFFAALAFIPVPKKITENPRERAFQILLPLWFVELPIAVICHFYNISKPRWELWVLLLAIFSVLIVFGTLVGFYDDDEVYKKIPEYAAIAAFSIGFPMAMVWSYAPQHGHHLPLYGAIIVTFASVAVFFYLRDVLLSHWRPDHAYSIFFIVLCVLVAVPITVVWDTLPANNIVIPTWVQISVTCGSTFLFSMFIAFVPAFSQNLWDLAALLFWASTAAWIPALLWAGHIDAFKNLTQNRTNTIHVTWTSILFWTVFWIFLYKSRRRLRNNWRMQGRSATLGPLSGLAIN